MSATAVDVQRLRPEPFDLWPEKFHQLAELAHRAHLTSSAYVQCLVTMAFDAIVLERPIRHQAFAPRLRQLAAQRTHVAKGEKRTSFSLDADDMNAIRKLRDVLQLPRRDLVVEYAIQAAWETKSPDDDGGNDGGSEDPRDRKRRLARFHNVENSRPRLRSLPLPGERLLPFFEEDSTKS